jgi:hypothetical protein
MAIFTSTTSDLTPFRRAVNYRLGCSSGVRKGSEAFGFSSWPAVRLVPSLIASLLVPVMRNLMLSKPSRINAAVILRPARCHLHPI